MVDPAEACVKKILRTKQGGRKKCLYLGSLFESEVVKVCQMILFFG